jgi:hypothetical protein
MHNNFELVSQQNKTFVLSFYLNTDKFVNGFYPTVPDLYRETDVDKIQPATLTKILHAMQSSDLAVLV